MDVLKLTDTSLAGLQQSVTNEARRRSLAATQGRDAASIIRGNEMAKRAASIAAAGQHSILFVGPANRPADVGADDGQPRRGTHDAFEESQPFDLLLVAPT